jgi:hypothetical protein
MSSKRDRRRAILTDDPAPLQPTTLKLIGFGSPGRAGGHCTALDAPAEFAQCLDCPYNRGARGSGILCAHRFGIDPTMVQDIPTQLDGDSIRRLDER